MIVVIASHRYWLRCILKKSVEREGKYYIDDKKNKKKNNEYNIIHSWVHGRIITIS